MLLIYIYIIHVYSSIHAGNAHYIYIYIIIHMRIPTRCACVCVWQERRKPVSPCHSVTGMILTNADAGPKDFPGLPLKLGASERSGSCSASGRFFALKPAKCGVVWLLCLESFNCFRSLQAVFKGTFLKNQLLLGRNAKHVSCKCWAPS